MGDKKIIKLIALTGDNIIRHFRHGYFTDSEISDICEAFLPKYKEIVKAKAAVVNLTPEEFFTLSSYLERVKNSSALNYVMMTRKGEKCADTLDMLSKSYTLPVSAPKIKAKTDVKVKPVDLTSTTDDILSANCWNNTKAFKSIKDKETQIKYYKRMNSSEEVLQLVDLDSKPFGSTSEKIIKEIFELGSRTSSQNDGTRNGKKIEIKVARYWNGTDDCRWQHLEPDHDYEIVLFVLLDFQGFKVWGIKKLLLMGDMRDKKFVTFQGKQGFWVKKSDIFSHLTPINSIADLDAFIQS